MQDKTIWSAAALGCGGKVFAGEEFPTDIAPNEGNFSDKRCMNKTRQSRVNSGFERHLHIACEA